MNNTCESNKVIERCKKKLLEGTNIESSPEEMAVLDNILFRFWQMGWLATDTNVGGNLIDRQAALDAIKKLEKPAPTAQHLSAIFDCEDTIKALPSAQPDKWDDTVYRKAVEMLLAYFVPEERYAEAVDGLRRLPSAQPGWIPCTPETMPTMTDTYLVIVGINENGEGMHTEVRTAEWNVIWQTWYVHTTRCFVGDIIKWMPIPREGRQNA